MSGFFDDFLRPGKRLPAQAPLKVSARTLGTAIENVLIYGYTRRHLETVLGEELKLAWARDDSPTNPDYTKRTLVQAYMPGWSVPQMASLARRIVLELDIPDTQLIELTQLLDTYDTGGGVHGPAKNLIFAANGPKPEIVLRDAMSNDLEIVKHAEHCLIYDEPLPAEGLRFGHLVEWWRDREGISADTSARDVGLDLHARLRESLADNRAELVIFDTYAKRYRKSYDIPVLIPQVYLHYDPYDQRTRRASTGSAVLSRQRMDFLLLFSDRRRVVIEVDGRQHYANGDTASPDLYGQMVAEDRRLRLAGYEVFRFGGAELFRRGSNDLVATFFDDLAERMR
jgi:hypothetical protein